MTPAQKRKLTLAINAYGRACKHAAEKELLRDQAELSAWRMIQVQALKRAESIKSRRKARLYAVVEELSNER